ncbi:SoxZ [Achromatium sp. WMS2]|nr:SoxZ [Achromatium sp. WMS2]
MATGNTIRIKAKAKSDTVEVKSLISHPMETGLRKDSSTNELIPAHFIQELTAELNGKIVMTAYWGIAISKNPYVSFEIKGGKKGDTVRLTWTDNKGESDSLAVKVH